MTEDDLQDGANGEEAGILQDARRVLSPEWSLADSPS